MKGVLAAKGTDQRLVFQGVHPRFAATFDREWQRDEPRTNTLVFIGRNFARTALPKAVKACLSASRFRIKVRHRPFELNTVGYRQPSLQKLRHVGIRRQKAQRRRSARAN